MSVMILDTKYVVAIANFCAHNDISETGSYINLRSLGAKQGAIKLIADKLHKANVDSSNARYKESGGYEAIEVTQKHAMAKPAPNATLINAVTMLEYNCDENPDYIGSAAERILNAVYRAIATANRDPRMSLPDVDQFS